MTGLRASYSRSRLSTSAAPWIAFTPRQLRAECARSPRVRTSTRMVPWHPASTTALDGSISTAKSAVNRSGSDSLSRRRPLNCESISSAS